MYFNLKLSAKSSARLFLILLQGGLWENCHSTVPVVSITEDVMLHRKPLQTSPLALLLAPYVRVIIRCHTIS